MSNGKVKVIIRIMPKGDEIDADLPIKATADQIIKKLLSDQNLKLPQKDPQGAKINYELLCKETGKTIESKETLVKAGVKDDHTLLLSPKVIAGYKKAK